MTLEGAPPRPLTAASGVVLTIVSASVYALAFPPVALFPLAYVALVPLWWVAARVTPRRAAAYGALWGILAAYGVGTWFPGMITDYFGWPWWAGWLGFVGAALGSASLYYGAFAAWVAWLAARGRLSPFVLAAGWVVCELARVRFLLGNPWGLLAYSQTQSLPIIQVADLGGASAVTLAVACVNAAVLAAVVPMGRGGRLRTAMPVLAVPLASLAYGAWCLGQTYTPPPSVRIGIVQSGLAREWTWRPGMEAFGLQQHLDLTRTVAADDVAVVLWPESAIAFYLQEPSRERDDLLAASRALGVDLVLGGPHYAFDDDQTRYYNSVFFVRRGEVVDRYDKRLLLPFAESNPFGPWLARATPTTPGTRVTAVELSGVRLGPLVCSESMQPGPAATMVEAGADVIVNLSNDSWMRAASAARHQRDIAVLRAVESRRYLVRAASTGISAIVDPHGRVLAEAPAGGPAFLVGTVAPGNRRTTYHRFGDVLGWLCVLVAIHRSVAAARGTRMTPGDGERWPNQPAGC